MSTAASLDPPPAVAVGKVIGIIERMNLENTGKFWDYAGGQLPW